MDIVRHVLTAAVLALVFRWLWKSSANAKAQEEAGRKIFPPAAAIRILTMLAGVVFAALLVLSSVGMRKPNEWWVPFLFLGFLAMVPFMYPPLLTIEVDGISSRSWFGSEKKIRWEDVASLQYNTGNKHFTVRGKDGCKIAHAGFNADPEGFQREIQARTRLPLQVAQPGTWKTKVVEIPFEER